MIGAALPTSAQQSLVAVPKFEGLVTDLTGTLTAEQQAVLEQKLTAVQARKGAQLALLLVPTTQPEDIAQYSIRVVDAWKVGSKLADDGVLLLVAKSDRKLRIEVGRGLEGALTDIASNRIIEDTITPLFRQNDFFGGINAGFDQIIRVIDGEPLPPPDEQWRRQQQGQRERAGSPGGILRLAPFLLIGVFIGSAVLRSILGRGVGSLATAGLTGFLVWIATQVLGFALLAGLFALLVAFFTGLGGGRSGGTGPLWWGGGFGGGGGGFGGGGFSGGGGGGFSGGGASGSW